jgi:hypothetical protein
LKARLLTERDVKEEKGKHHPYVAFRRRVEKMTTRKVMKLKIEFIIYVSLSFRRIESKE